MEILSSPRQTGKTSWLIRQIDETGGTLVVRDKRARKYVMEMAKRLGYIINPPITYYEFINDVSIDGAAGFYIDDMDLFIQYIAKGKHIKAITMTTKHVTGE